MSGVGGKICQSRKYRGGTVVKRNGGGDKTSVSQDVLRVKKSGENGKTLGGDEMGLGRERKTREADTLWGKKTKTGKRGRLRAGEMGGNCKTNMQGH